MQTVINDLYMQPGDDDIRHRKVNDYSGHYWEIVVRSLSEGTEHLDCDRFRAIIQ